MTTDTEIPRNEVNRRPDQTMRIGWARADLTPDQPVLLCGQFHARVSEGVRDPVTATALAIEGAGTAGDGGAHAVLVSCDLVAISEALRDAVRERLHGVGGLDPAAVILGATHTHTAPEISEWTPELDYGSMDRADYIAFAAERIAGAVCTAWEGRAAGGMSFGLGHAVVGHNRRWVDDCGRAHMYGNTSDPTFQHIEGWEDHALNLFATWNADGGLTGLVVNLACPSQVSENEFQVSADFWHETRIALRKRFGKELHILGQVSAAGDLSPHHIIRRRAEERMQALAARSRRDEIATRITAGVAAVMPILEREIAWAPLIRHRHRTLALSGRNLTQADADHAAREAAACRSEYDRLKVALANDPEHRSRPRWYVDISRAAAGAAWNESVARRFEAGPQKHEVEVHALRIGDLGFATNPFELYLDYGARMMARSPAVQTCIVQLSSGIDGYLPADRAARAGGYGAVPASAPVGPEGGAELVAATLEMLESIWVENA